MASYTLSPVWGAGAQLFDNAGNVLTGGKIETYEAGTTTNAVTYTDPVGNFFNPNPIIADASGRLSNEIWLPVGIAYKFVLKDTNGVLIATYDNIPTAPQPPIANDASSISYEQGYTVTAGAFTVGATYLITSVGSTNFVAIGAAANATGILFTATGVGSGNGTAQYSRTVQTKLRETVSVKDFGAVGDGVTDDTAAIQAAIDSLPLNTANVGILTPEGFANGGEIFIPRGRYKITSTINLRRGLKLQGESRESSQIVSFFAGSVLQYLDAGRAYPDEIVISSLSIWQDSSVTATSGAGIDVIDGPATIEAVFLRVDDVIVKGTYHGIRLSAAIGCGVRDSMISNTISHGVAIPAGVGFTQSTSSTFENVYSQQSVTGSGFFLQSTAYTNFISCAADVNARYGYELNGTINISIFSGAEVNTLGGVLLFQCRGTQCFANIVDNTTSDSNAVTLDQSSATVIGGVHSSGVGATGYSIYSLASGTAATFSAGLIRTGGWNNVAQRNNGNNFLELNQLSGFVGGLSKRWAFNAAGPLTSIQLHNSGVSDSTVVNGFVTDVELAAPGTISSAVVARARTQNVAVTWPILNGQYFQAPVKGAASTVTRYNSLLVDESAIGSTANTNLAIGTASPPAGNWSIYNASTRANYQGGATIFGQLTSAAAPNGSLFVDSADGVLKFKNSAGVVNALY